MVLGGISFAALVLGLVVPLRWGVWAFVAAAALLFAAMVGIHAATGFEGESIEESLFLFGGSYVSYLGFNVQITYRAFAVPLFALAALMIFRMGRSARADG
ncbi:hypothetical protein ACS3SW_14750 [Roseobacteraceae bacterium S113]